MNGQEIVTLAEVLTGRTNESSKMLARVNVIQKMLWSQYDWDFAIDQTAFATDPISLDNTFTYNAAASILHATFWAVNGNDGTNRGNGNWLYSTTDEKFIKLNKNNSTSLAVPEDALSGTITTPFNAHWFRLDYSLERFATDDNTQTFSTRENYSRLIRAWVDGSDSDLEVVSLDEWQRRVPQMDISDRGRPEFAALTTNFIQTLGVGTKSIEYKKGPVLRIWPIPDAAYRVHYEYYTSPTDLTLLTSPLPSDDKWHQALAFGAAYLTRLDDVDSTWLQFKAEYDEIVNQLTWTYKITPNYAPSALGPRQSERGANTSKVRPFS